MNGKAPKDQAFKVSNDWHPTFVTLPSERLCHYITDDELDGIGQMQHEPVMEIFLVAIGAFIGLIIPGIEAVGKFLSDKATLLDLATLMVLTLSLGVAGVTGFLWNKRSSNRKNLVGTIRDRKRVPVQSV